MPGTSKTPNALTAALAALGSAQHNAADRKPSKKVIVGSVAGAGIGAAAIATQRRGSSREKTSTTSWSPAPASRQTDSPISPAVAPVEASADVNGATSPSSAESSRRGQPIQDQPTTTRWMTRFARSFQPDV